LRNSIKMFIMEVEKEATIQMKMMMRATDITEVKE
jgi:hypothetical protein